jgi:hypothetical protein
MANHSDNDRNRRMEQSWNGRKHGGLALIALGSVLLFGKLGVLAANLPDFFASIGVDALGAPAALWLSLLRLFRTIVFHPAALLPMVCGILVLSFALTGILFGVILLRKQRFETAR